MGPPEREITDDLADTPADAELDRALRRHPTAAIGGDPRDLRAAIGVELNTLGVLITALRLEHRDGDDVALDDVHKLRDHIQTLVTLVGMVRRAGS